MRDALAGIAVLDLSIWRPGPYATSLLSQLGADVLKIEPPGGDPLRQYPDLFASVNRGKRSLLLDLKQPGPRQRATELAARADVIVEGFRPGVLGRFALDEPSVRAFNRRVVYCSISGYGQDDPRAAVPGHDINYQAWAGALSPEGGPASLPPLPVADLAAGVTAAFGICAALIGRGPDGDGTYLDLAMTDLMATWAAPSPGDPGDGPAAATGVPGYGLYSTADGRQIALGVVSEQPFWSALCHALDCPDLADLAFAQRRDRAGELDARLRLAIVARDRDPLVATLLSAGVPVAPVLNRTEVRQAGVVPPFPIRSGLVSASPTPPPVPQLDQHDGQGWGRSEG